MLQTYSPPASTSILPSSSQSPPHADALYPGKVSSLTSYSSGSSSTALPDVTSSSSTYKMKSSISASPPSSLITVFTTVSNAVVGGGAGLSSLVIVHSYSPPILISIMPSS